MNHRFSLLCAAALLFCAVSGLRLSAQPAAALHGLRAQLPLTPPTDQSSPSNPLTDPSFTPGTTFLFDLEAKFARATAAGGGAAFSSFFADDAVTLANGKAPVVGKAAIASQATWAAKDYQLTWTPEGGRMSSTGDMGFTWGHYEGTAVDSNGNPVVTGGRYFTVWKRQPDGTWKVELDASNTEPPKSGDCCRLP